MAQNSDLVLRHCLVWDVEKPYRDVPRKSSNFSLLGFEWNFEMCLYYDSQYRYKITLQKVTDQEPLKTDLTIRTFICSSSLGTCLYRINIGKPAKRDIWSCTESAVNQWLGGSINGKCKIIFYIDAPCMLQLSRSETEHSQLGTVTDSPQSSAPKSSEHSKAILSEDKCVQASFIDVSPDMESLSHDFSQLLEHKIFPDVQLRCGDRSIRSHRSILASRSDVFAAMFRNKMAESETGAVDVTDVDADVFDLLLKYVYSGKIPELSEDNASSLYAAGDKYSIQALKKACSDWMVEELTEENCLGFLILADAHSDENFKDRVVSFVAEHLEALDKQVWSEFNKDHSGLAVSVYLTFNASTLSKQPNTSKKNVGNGLSF